MDGHAWPRPGAVVPLLLLAALLSSAAAQIVPVFFVVGESLVVTPRVSGTLSSIVWDLNGDLVVEWANSELEFFSSYKGRTDLNLTTGQLVIHDATEADEGKFSVAINKVKQGRTYQAEAIKRVPKPEVQVRTLTCSPDSTSCTLTCSGDPTGAGPVTYSWRKGTGAQWGPEQESPDFSLENNSNKEEGQGVGTISCRMKNPVGEEESDALENPFYPKSNPGPVVGIVVGVLILVIAVVGVGVWKKQAIKNRFCQKQEGGAPVGEGRSNSPPAGDKAKGSETQPLNGERSEVSEEKGSDPPPPTPAAIAP